MNSKRFKNKLNKNEKQSYLLQAPLIIGTKGIYMKHTIPSLALLLSVSIQTFGMQQPINRIFNQYATRTIQRTHTTQAQQSTKSKMPLFILGALTTTAACISHLNESDSYMHVEYDENQAYSSQTKDYGFIQIKNSTHVCYDKTTQEKHIYIGPIHLYKQTETTNNKK
jgi:hypothetical protein